MTQSTPQGHCSKWRGNPPEDAETLAQWNDGKKRRIIKHESISVSAQTCGVVAFDTMSVVVAIRRSVVLQGCFCCSQKNTDWFLDTKTSWKRLDWSFFTMNVLHFRLETSAMLLHWRADGGSFKQSCGRQFDRYDKIHSLPYFQYAGSVSTGICSRRGEDQNSSVDGESSRVQPRGLCMDGVTGKSLSLSWNVQLVT